MANEENVGKQAPENNQTSDTTSTGFPKDDLLNLEKGAAALNELGQQYEGVHGKGIGGSGSGPSTGDTTEDYERPSTDGVVPKNDYVSPEPLPNETVNDVSSRAGEAEDALRESNEALENEGQGYADPGSGFPGGGAVRTAEDKLNPETTADEE